MTIEEMQYDFKKKMNKIDSQQYRNLLIPEIDWTLNEALRLFVKMIAKPRIRSHVGFEIGQRSIDDIRALVVRPSSSPKAIININNNIAELPDNYWHFIRGRVETIKGDCTGTNVLHIRQHDDEFEENNFSKSSFEWRHTNAIFFEKGLQLFDDGSFVNNKLLLSYLRLPLYMHNAKDFRTGYYNLPSGEKLVGSQDCELSEHTHDEIVDIAVLLASGEINANDYQLKMTKLKYNNLS